MREALIFMAAFLFGLVILPMLIYAAGQLALGPYAHGGASWLMSDFFAGLASGSLAFWTAALGPYVFLMMGRGLLRLIRRGP